MLLMLSCFLDWFVATERNLSVILVKIMIPLWACCDVSVWNRQRQLWNWLKLTLYLIRCQTGVSNTTEVAERLNCSINAEKKEHLVLESSASGRCLHLWYRIIQRCVDYLELWVSVSLCAYFTWIDTLFPLDGYVNASSSNCVDFHTMLSTLKRLSLPYHRSSTDGNLIEKKRPSK